MCIRDRYSGYAWTRELKRTDTASVVGQLSNWFTEVGWPTSIRTDGGPQFRTDFTLLCNRHGIKHELLSPYNPESKGLAEAAVKNIKSFITCCNKEGENIKLAKAAWKHMTRTDGLSPSQLFYGRRQRQLLPITGVQAKIKESTTAGSDITAGISERNRNLHMANYTELQPRDKVWMQHHVTGKWDTTVQVTKKRKDGNSYVVTAQDGNTNIRGRRLLKPINLPNTHEEKTSLQAPLNNMSTPDKCDTSADPKAMPRRSPRNHVSTRAADIKIAARLTALYFCDLEDGSETLSANRRRGTQGLN